MKRKTANRYLNSKSRFGGQNQGFSLVEVLVCLAIVAIFCIPLFRGFRYAAYNNSEAHHSQSVTTYVQQTLEAIKGMRLTGNDSSAVAAGLAELLRDGSEAGALPAPIVTTAVTATGELTTKVFNTVAGTPTTYEEVFFKVPAGVAKYNGYSGRDDHSVYQGKGEFNKLFTVVSYHRDDINVGGRHYRLDVEMNPLPYDLPNANSESDVNIYALADVEGIDGASYAVITDEIHRYEENQTILYLFQEHFTGTAGKNFTLEEIYRGLEKTVKVSIADASSHSSGGYLSNSKVNVYCDVEYSFSDVSGAYMWTQTYNVYSGAFPLDCGCLASNHSDFAGWKSGGKVYVSAKAYYDPEFGAPTSNEVPNNIEFQTRFSGVLGDHHVEGWDIYLIRGAYPTESPSVYSQSYNFNKVAVDGTVYFPVAAGKYMTGEQRIGNDDNGYVNFHTNIKGDNAVLAGSQLSSSERENATVGVEKPLLRSYDVTVTLTEQDTGDVAAQATTSKKLM